MKKLPQNNVSKQQYLQTKGRLCGSRRSGPIRKNKVFLQFADFDLYKSKLLINYTFSWVFHGSPPGKTPTISAARRTPATA